MPIEQGHTSARYVPDIPPPVANTRPPAVRFPAGACDCHAHIFGPPELDRLLPNTHFRPHETPLPDYLRMLGVLGVVGRQILVLELEGGAEAVPALARRGDIALAAQYGLQLTAGGHPLVLLRRQHTRFDRGIDGADDHGVFGRVEQRPLARALLARGLEDLKAA